MPEIVIVRTPFGGLAHRWQRVREVADPRIGSAGTSRSDCEDGGILSGEVMMRRMKNYVDIFLIWNMIVTPARAGCGIEESSMISVILRAAPAWWRQSRKSAS